MSIFDSFVRKREYLICVDSEGCAMDTMNCKHFHCFGPCMVLEWGLDQWRIDVLERWNEINLFQMTRGVNRFKGLAMVLTEVDGRFMPIPGVKELRAWVENADTLSEDALADAIVQTPEGDGKVCLEKVLSWSKAVNASIALLPGELKQPFAGVLEGIAAAHTFADVAVVSGSNREAAEEVWQRHGLLAHTDILLAQDCGSKTSCIARLLEFGYEKDHVLMIGDAPGDCDAAEENGVRFYPILVNHEKESWEELRGVALLKLQEQDFEAYQLEKKRQFLSNLGG